MLELQKGLLQARTSGNPGEDLASLLEAFRVAHIKEHAFVDELGKEGKEALVKEVMLFVTHFLGMYKYNN